MQIVAYNPTTGDAALSFTVTPMSPGGSWRLLNITTRAHAEVATALIVQLDAVEGTIHDTYLSSDATWTYLFKTWDEGTV